MEAVGDQGPPRDVAAGPADRSDDQSGGQSAERSAGQSAGKVGGQSGGQSGQPVGHPGDVAGGVAGELLAGLDGLPVADHVPIFERAHATLVAMLDDETGQPGDRAGEPARSLASPPRG